MVMLGGEHSLIIWPASHKTAITRQWHQSPAASVFTTLIVSAFNGHKKSLTTFLHHGLNASEPSVVSFQASKRDTKMSIECLAI